MLSRMMGLWANGEASDEDKEKACAWAKECAPYLHPRLSSVEAKVTHRDLSELGERELLEELAALRENADPGDSATLN
jgi:hypothetical protein